MPLKLAAYLRIHQVHRQRAHAKSFDTKFITKPAKPLIGYKLVTERRKEQIVENETFEKEGSNARN